METLFKNKNHIFDIINKVNTCDKTLYSYYNINNYIIDNNTISIVMTASNRSKQVYFTLKTFANSVYKNIQVIIVDDSNIDAIDIEKLSTNNYPFNIVLIKINRANKSWHNPLVNYNIGFKFIKGGKVIIQNAEVCHIGDVLSFVNKNITDDNYYVLDVKASLDFNTNEQIYNKNTDECSIFNENLFLYWYQSEHQHNRNLHFLTALTIETFNKIKCFNYDYSMGSWYDDDDFLLKIISKGIKIINVYHDKHLIGGIHLYHQLATSSWDCGVESNAILFSKKQHIYNLTGIYIDVTENIEEFEEKYNKLAN